MPPPAKPSRQSARLGPDYARRLSVAAKASAAAGVPALLVTNPIDVAYLTGFLGGDSYLLVGPPKAVIISDFRYQEELSEAASRCDIHIRKGSLVEAAAQVVGQAGVTRLGVQGEHMTLNLRQALGRQAKGVKLVETSGLIARQRLKKDDHEVGLIRRGVRIQQEALEAILPVIGRRLKKRAGSITEAEIAALLEAEMKTRGSSKPSFDTIVAARAMGSRPHYAPAAVKLTRGQPLLIDWGAIFKGYHSDMTRVICWGRWPRGLDEVYRIVLHAHEAAAAALAPGKSTREIDGVARGIIKDAGYGDRFGHGLGHGIGLDIHEEPRLSHNAADVALEPGHVVTIEPGIYLPGVGGVRIEDDYLITERGARNLCTLPKTLEWASR